jgi:hypothetical protein
MKRKDKMPFPVYFALLGLESRAAAQGFLWLCVFFGVVSAMLGFMYPLAFTGTAFLPCAGWYWYAIRWVDQHSGWDKA